MAKGEKMQKILDYVGDRVVDIFEVKRTGTLRKYKEKGEIERRK